MGDVKLLLQSAMIFFGTLMAAGLLALGEPAPSRVQRNALHEKPNLQALNRVVDAAWSWADMRSAQRGR